MTQSYSMAYLTANNVPPLEAISLASDLGFDKISFRLLPAGPGDTPPPLMADDSLFEAVAQSLHHNGIAMSDAEMIRLNGDTDLDRFRPFLEKCQRLGAKHVLIAGDDLDRARITETYARLCALTWEYELTADLEFMPWTAIKNIQDARDLVEAAAHPAAAILFDCLHFDRSDSTLEEISAIPAEMMNYVQICDGPIPYDPTGDAMMSLGRTARVIPGTGGIDLPAIISRLPKGVPISVEVPNVALAREIGVRELVRRSLEETQKLITG